MILRSLTLRNFKAVGDTPVTIELKPITLLFGPNSAGKSTIIQALHYARELFVSRNPNPDRTAIGGQSVDLGGFLSLVHDHDKDREVVIRFDCIPPLGDEFTADFEDDEEEAGVTYAGFILDEAESAWVEVAVSWSELLNRPVVTRYQVGFDGRRAAEIPSSRQGTQVALTYLDLRHPRFTDGSQDDLFSSQIDSMIREEYFDPSGNVNFVLDQRSAMPAFGHSLPFALQIFPEPYGQHTDDGTPVATELAGTIAFFTVYLSRAILGPGQAIERFLEGLAYLGPLREIPARDFRSPFTPDYSRRASGVGSWDHLYGASSEFAQELNNWLARDDRLNSGYRIEVRRFKELDIGLAARLESGIVDELEEIKKEVRRLPERVRVVLVDQRRNLELQPQDVGIGISQVVPVVVEALRAEDCLVAIEQPELHIHPAFQVALGDLFITRAKSGNAAFLLETHSEHLMLRFQRRIRETTEGMLPPDIPPLTPDDLSIIFLDQMPDGSVSAYPIRVDEDGDFIDRWPKGFFPQRFEEHYGS